MDIIKLNEKIINHALVEYLEKMLEEAKEGNLQSVAGCGLYRNGDVLTIKSLGEFADSFKLLGAITHLQFVLTAEMDE